MSGFAALEVLVGHLRISPLWSSNPLVLRDVHCCVSVRSVVLRVGVFVARL